MIKPSCFSPGKLWYWQWQCDIFCFYCWNGIFVARCSLLLNPFFNSCMHYTCAKALSERFREPRVDSWRKFKSPSSSVHLRLTDSWLGGRDRGGRQSSCRQRENNQPVAHWPLSGFGGWKDGGREGGSEWGREGEGRRRLCCMSRLWTVCVCVWLDVPFVF